MITVANKRSGATGEYIGRPSLLGNPFQIGPDGDRAGVIKAYRRWLAGVVHGPDSRIKTEFLRLVEIARHKDLTLVCWCAPLACHGDVLKEAITHELV